ncbi:MULTISPECIES: bifunctional phosphoribosylaminoimidazolecarboxamide formyltransferase/IMP cyclohydrolase [Delftia]|jgi:phosphoribosylaminoimidazolecarboxamide formyltransferase / IMP cyclohydrolase|uniref:bifunctional phosphoribosylaminoimidazolecarboxamide formyltransferase/IMP cyclohydrolase n=1 Tax=Delftia TaxID=80865 RepID=UPI000F82FEAE|nr:MULTISPECIES: bifunctional phosphoribosylaminoimidazolecarboxamide formyltransferase/IMP cyclohydrolase [Delftia]MDH0850607.1 bifunctional phosphoribosylaminoimidazolecarboxamide formyltransferase/IMP cyclohydrolase [Delftia tsuruhatensis]QRI89682.1 bifunctional phosphoribosylaminoimidazolecarboxamide formyltransferase/IMP cyclohydrolase [Delftia lacustris]WEL99609.1 bifunctional phosphoribosylaminoimidazolecarboxamide formyltransferase/IMP cyclohydrolase [Delftia tsuruhatensis]WQM82229.1 bi
MNALLSVSDKTGIVEFAQGLHALGIKLLSTGGTAKLLAEAGLPVTEVAEVTQFPEMLDGRVKTLHPKVHGGLLARRELPAHMAALKEHGIDTIDLLVVNLYPFEATVAKAGCTLADAIENIDIGGPAMVRSAAKNWADVGVITDAGQYEAVLGELKANGKLSDKLRFALSVAAFNRIAQYDGAISDYLSSVKFEDDKLSEAYVPERSPFPGQSNGHFTKVQDLRYGENSHQQAALYRDLYPAPGSLVTGEQLQGKELSYNNIADADAAWECVKSFEQPACVIVKHANPCGVAVGKDAHEAYAKAFQTDPTSAFGGIIAFNRTVDKAAAEAVVKQFVEVLMAPDFTAEALEIFKPKVNVRLMKIALPAGGERAWDQGRNAVDAKRVGSGLLLQTADNHELALADLKVVTVKQPTPEELQDLLFAWKVAKYVKSNAIVFCKNGMTMGVGAGQMSRLDSARIASIKAEAAKLSLQGTVVASDAFFPFRDGLDVVVDAGATCVAQPGGSMRDQEVIDAANERGVAMVFTGVRHFRH